MTEQEEKKIVLEAGKLLHKIPGFRGKICYNIIPGRDYVNVNIEKSVALEYNGNVILDLNKRKPNK